MNLYSISNDIYRKVAKPMLFKFDPENIHDVLSSTSHGLVQNLGFSPKIQEYGYSAKVGNLEFKNIVGLAAGFDYEGYWAKSMPFFGFGFNTVGTVANISYEGNKKPRLTRLVNSKSILVNKGFKSSGAIATRDRLRGYKLPEKSIGVSIGASNSAVLDSPNKNISDILAAFEIFKGEPYIKYFELNISCPNTINKATFYELNNFETLLREVEPSRIDVPIFLKMPIDFDLKTNFQYVERSMKEGINTFIFSNLQKDRSTITDKTDSKTIEKLAGGLSGAPTFNQSNELIANVKREFKNDVVLVGCGGIFTPEDAWHKITSGASLLQLITGMIYNGPFLPHEINMFIDVKLRQNNCNFADVVGSSL